MHRLLALGRGGLAAACLLALGALGCASQPISQSTTQSLTQSATPSVDAGPPACAAIQARIDRSEADYVAKAGTWLDSPNRMVETRRLRALQARADELHCALPRS
jgi:hypothetical protein